MKYTKQEIRMRAISRLAEVLYDHWEEGRDGHSRIFEVLIPDEFVIVGRSVQGGGYREHIVPCVVIRTACKAMYDRGASISTVAEAIEKHLMIAIITPEEAKRMDIELQLKTAMPAGWIFGESDPLARLKAAGIELV